MVASQLNQLKSKLKEQGLSRNNAHSSKKQRKNRGPQENASTQRQSKLEALHAEMNTFDVKYNRKKHDIGNTRADKGKPAQSKQAAIENVIFASFARDPAWSLLQRRKSILPELLDRNRAGGVIDRRFGEDNPYLTPEEKALERFQKERQRVSGRKDNLFNLEDEDMLTHYGKTLGDETVLGSQEQMFQASTLPREVDEEVRESTVCVPNSGLGAVSREALDQRDHGRGRSQKQGLQGETLCCTYVDSHIGQYERQKNKTEDDELRMELDADLDGLRAALGMGGSKKRKAVAQEVEESEDEQDGDSEASDADEDKDDAEGPESAAPESGVDRDLLNKLIGSPSPEPEASTSAPTFRPTEEEDDYDRYVRELGFEKRGKPSDRLKTAEEQAKEAAERLKAQEAARMRRMQGLEEDAADERQRGGDDLDDDFLEEEGDDGGEFGLGPGLSGGQEAAAVSLDDVGSEFEGGGDEDESSEGSDEEASGDALDGLADALEEQEDDFAIPPLEPLVGTNRKGKKTASELAFVLPCPSEHEELIALLDTSNQLATVIERIKTLYHPSLAPDNNQKLAVSSYVSPVSTTDWHADLPSSLDRSCAV
jgi:nucleolar protein 14